MVSVDEPTTAAPGAPDGPHRRRHWPLVVGLCAGVLALAGGSAALVAARSGAPGPPSASIGTSFDRPVPAAVATLPLVDQAGRATTLESFHGEVVLVAPFLTSCQEVCPITTGVLLQVQAALAAAGLSRQVALLEVTVDPGRDTPTRLAAYAHATRADWPLLTGTPASLDALWHYLGVTARVVPEDTPPGIDWQTGKPYTYDVDHSDGYFLLDQRGRERFSTGGMPHVAGTLPPALGHMLDAQGRTSLASPGLGAWGVSDALGSIGWLEGRSIPATGD